MTKRVKELIRKMRESGLAEKIRKVVSDMKRDKEITKDSEIPEHYGKISNNVGFEDIKKMSIDTLRAFTNIVDRELEKVFGMDVYAGYFVTESFNPITKSKFNSLLEKAVDSLYSKRYYIGE